MISASTLTALRCNMSGPMDCRMSSTLQCFFGLSSTPGNAPFPQAALPGKGLERMKRKLQRSGLILAGIELIFFIVPSMVLCIGLDLYLRWKKKLVIQGCISYVGQYLESHSLLCFSYYPTRLEVHKELGGDTASGHFAVLNPIQLPWPIIPACTGPSTEPSYPPADQHSCPSWCHLKTD